MSEAPRLVPHRLAALATSVRRPRYAREALAAGIVHIGLGAFARAHLAAATEHAIDAGGDLRWGIVGASLRSTGTCDALAPQQGLYTLMLRDADGQGRPRQRLQVIGCVTGLLAVADDPWPLVERIAAPATRIVSVTVTEKGYHAAALGAADVIAQGLALRRQRGLPGFTALALDNLPANGRVLQALVAERAAAIDARLPAWIDTHASFPCSMVDRIVPRTTDADRAEVAAALGLHDAGPVVAEPYFDWVVEDRFVAGRPDWAAAGVRFVDDAAPWEQMKLRLVNGAHSAIAYLGVLAGWRTVHEAMADATLAHFIEHLLREELAPTLPPLPGLDLDTWVAALLRRFRNPALAHRTLQIAMDGSQKLPQRWLAALRERLARGQPSPGLCLALAAWIEHLRGADEAGVRFNIDDPLAGALAAHAEQGQAMPDREAEARHWLAFAPVFGPTPRAAPDDLAVHPDLAAALGAALHSLRTCGVRASLAAARARAAQGG